MKPKNVVLDRVPSIDPLGNWIFLFGIYIQFNKLTNPMHDTLNLVLMMKMTLAVPIFSLFPS